MSALRSGQTLLHYRVGDRIGQGGMGEVYRAEDLKLGRRVAIKVLAPAAALDDNAGRRFLGEARSASALNHPNIVTIYAIEEVDAIHFIVMEYVEGDTLRARIERGSLDFAQVIEWGLHVGDALGAAHDLGLVHRDIKSANILITPRGQAKVLDFGLAKVAQHVAMDTAAATVGGDLTAAGLIVGTVAYMSPEQTRGEALDGRSDLFSLGVVLYEAATGRLPFRGPSALAVMHEIAAIDPPPPSRIRADLPREFDLVIERALAKDRDRRFASASELVATLRDLRGSTPVTPSPPPAATRFEDAVGEGEAFVGRERELRQLEQSLVHAVEGSGRMVFLTGEPGIGKSALADEFLRRARRRHPGLVLGRGRCLEQYGPGEAYLPFYDALTGLLTGPGGAQVNALLRSQAPTWCLQLPGAFSSHVRDLLQHETIGATKERMLREMSDALGALAASSPIALLLEDLHWADPSSIDLLGHICQRIGRQRLLVVGTFRPEDVELSQHPLRNFKREMEAHKLCDEIAVGALSERHVADYLEARFAPNDFPGELAALIERRTEGHPLFATSLVQYLAEHGDIVKTNRHWTLGRGLTEMDLEVPENVRGMIRKKIDALDENDRRALQYASVEGEEFTSTVVARLLGMDDLALEERLDRIDRAHRLIETRSEEKWPDGTLGMRYRFAHALYQNVLYQDLITKRRMMLHIQAAEQLVERYGAGAPRIATQLAMHFERGRDFSRAIEYLVHAGDNAATVYANAEAEGHYSSAIALVDRLPPGEQAERLIPLYQKRGTVNQALSRFSQAVDDFTGMLGRSRAVGSPVLEHAALNALATMLFWSHRMDEMVSCVRDALHLADASGNEALRVETMWLMAQKHLSYGEPSEGKPLADEVIRIARALGHKPTLLGGLVNRGMWHFFQSEYARADELLTEAQRLASELRNGFMLLVALFGRGLALGNLGRTSDALRLLHEALEMARRNGDHFHLPRLPNCIGWIHRELQDFARARAHDESGLEIARTDHVLEAEANSLINLGYDYTVEGNSTKPLAAFRQAADIFERDAWFRWRYNIRLQAGQAEYWLAQGDAAKAGEYVGRLLDTATRYEAHKYVAVAHKLRAELAAARGDAAEARRELDAAVVELDRYPVPILAWKVHAALARVHAQLGDSRSSRAAIARAASIAREIAANVEDETLRATFMNSEAVRALVS